MRVMIELYRAAELPPDVRQQLVAWSDQLFGPSEYQWAWPEWHVLVRVDGHLVSHVGVLVRAAAAGGRLVKLGGIGMVMTLPAWRHRGLASAALRRAADFMCRELRVEFGLLLCAEFRAPFYERLGWRRVEGPLVFHQPGGRVRWRGVTMVLPCRDRPWQPGPIALRGLPW